MIHLAPFALATLVLAPSAFQVGTEDTASSVVLVGSVDGNQTWSTKDFSIYCLQEPVVVPKGVTLTVSGGVEVRFVGNGRLDVKGRLRAKGKADMPVMFRAYGLPSTFPPATLRISGEATFDACVFHRVAAHYYHDSKAPLNSDREAFTIATSTGLSEAGHYEGAEDVAFSRCQFLGRRVKFQLNGPQGSDRSDWFSINESNIDAQHVVYYSGAAWNVSSSTDNYDVTISSCWWGTPDSEALHDKITGTESRPFELLGEPRVGALIPKSPRAKRRPRAPDLSEFARDEEGFLALAQSWHSRASRLSENGEQATGEAVRQYAATLAEVAERFPLAHFELGRLLVHVDPEQAQHELEQFLARFPYEPVLGKQADQLLQLMAEAMSGKSDQRTR